jgi:hypothetical protein
MLPLVNGFPRKTGAAAVFGGSGKRKGDSEAAAESPYSRSPFALLDLRPNAPSCRAGPRTEAFGGRLLGRADVRFLSDPEKPRSRSGGEAARESIELQAQLDPCRIVVRRVLRRCD